MPKSQGIAFQNKRLLATKWGKPPDIDSKIKKKEELRKFIFQSKVLANQKKSHSMQQNNGTLKESTEKETAECESTVEATKAKRKKHVSLALQDRVLVIDMHNQGMSTRKIAAELGLQQNSSSSELCLCINLNLTSAILIAGYIYQCLIFNKRAYVSPHFSSCRPQSRQETMS